MWPYFSEAINLNIFMKCYFRDLPFVSLRSCENKVIVNIGWLTVFWILHTCYNKCRALGNALNLIISPNSLLTQHYNSYARTDSIPENLYWLPDLSLYVVVACIELHFFLCSWHGRGRSLIMDHLSATVTLSVANTLTFAIPIES